MGAPELGIWTVSCTALSLFLTQPKPTLPGYGLVTCAGQEPARFVCSAVLAGSATRGGRAVLCPCAGQQHALSPQTCGCFPTEPRCPPGEHSRGSQQLLGHGDLEITSRLQSPCGPLQSQESHVNAYMLLQ